MNAYREAHEIDIHVGGRIRARREALGFSQGRLGRDIGLTFSQIQKYENGANRVSSGKLYQIARILRVQPAYFFEGLGETAKPVDRAHLEDMATFAQGIGDQRVRDATLKLIRALAEDNGIPAA